MNVYEMLEKVRHEKPLIHHLTNWVTIYDCAQVVKTLGASPVMAHAPEEVAEMAGIASALVLNIGTLTNEFVDAMTIAAQCANRKGIPVVLDVCGAGATRLRDEKCFALLENARIQVIKGNASEVARVAGQHVQTRGVDAAKVEGNLRDMAESLARARQATVVVTGAEDIVTDGQRTWLVANGDPKMGQVVGTGCMATSVIGTFAAVESDSTLAAVSGLTCYEIAAELAAERTAGPAAFKDQLFDFLYGLNQSSVETRQRITQIR